MTTIPQTTARTPRCFTCRAEMHDAVRAFHYCLACADRETADEVAHVRRRLDHRTPPAFRWATFDAPELRERVWPASAITEARAALAVRSLVFQGTAGMGKTSVARATWFARCVSLVKPFGREWSDRRLPTPVGVYASAFQLAKARAENRLGRGEAELIDDAIRAPVLLLDELGGEGARGDTAVAEVIFARHAAELPTIFTTPFEIADLTARYGDGVARRLFEGATVIRLGGQVH